MKFREQRRRFVAAGVVGATALGVAVVAPGTAGAAIKMAEAVNIQQDSDNAGVKAQGQTAAQLGGSYRITGQHWCYANKTGGQWIAVKLMDGATADTTAVTMPSAATLPQPDGTTADFNKRGVIAMLKASDDPTGQGNCTLDTTITLPTTANSTADATKFKAGTKHAIVLLAGSFGPVKENGGGAPHGATLSMTVGNPVVSTDRTATMTGERVMGLMGQYEGSYSNRTGKFYVSGVVMPSKAGTTTTNGASTIAEFDPTTKKFTRAVQLPVEDMPARMRGVDDTTGLKTQVMAYGIAVDDARGVIWSTDTRQNTVTAYSMATFKPVWRSAVGDVPGGRDIYVQSNGDVLVSGGGGLWKITGSGTSYSVSRFFDIGATGESATPMGLAVVPGGYVLNDLSSPNLTFLDLNGAKTGTKPLTGGSGLAGVRHGSLGADYSLGVIIEADQGARDAASGRQVNSGVSFYTTDGTPLGYAAVGTQNLSVRVDQDKHIGYVGDFASGNVYAFDMAAAKQGIVSQIGQLSAIPGGARGVNHLSMGGGKLLALGKDGLYQGVTVPYGSDIHNGSQVSFTGNADSAVLIDTAVATKTYAPATDNTTATAQEKYDISKLPLNQVVNPDPATPQPPVDPASNGSRGSLASQQPAQGGALGSLTGPMGNLAGPLGLLGLLGIGGFIAAAVSGAFTPILHMLGLQ